MENEILKLKDKDGNIKEYRILLVFKWYKTNKFYIVYTDNEKNLNNEYDVYAKIFDPNDLTVFEDIKTDEEWKVIEERLKEVGEAND